MSGKLIAFEGLDGTGKTTQIQILEKRLRDRGIPCMSTREPRFFRSLILNHNFDPAVDLLLFGADRALHVDRVIRPALEQGLVVLCDRYAASTIAYQCFGHGLPIQHCLALNKIACRGIYPSLSIWLDFQHAHKSGDRFEQQSSDFFRRVHNGYRYLEFRNPKFIRVIAGDIEVTANAIAQIVDAKLMG